MNDTGSTSPSTPAYGTEVAAFYDLEGTLCSTNIVHTYSYFARNQPTVLRTLQRTASLVASVPLFLAVDAYSRKFFNELFYRRYRGESEDRLTLMAEEMFDEVVRPSIFTQAYAMIRQSRAAGVRQVLITGALDLLAAPVARHLGMDDFVGNTLEMVDGHATGRIRPPLLAGATKANWMRRYAEERGLDLERCFSYSDSMSDYPMLTAVGRPTVINPDARLRSVARSFDWPILRFEN
ncbi:MAG: HAD-IB family hydrolase [Myxococcota bacterium]